MTRVWDEKFEGTGYEETWSAGETIGSGSSLDEDANTSDVSSPSGWGLQCLKADSVSPNFAAFVRHNPTPYTGSMYFRLEFVITAENLADTENNFIFNSQDNGNQVVTVQIRQDSGQLKIRLQINHDGSAANNFDANISLNTRYRVEWQFDIPNNLWEWRLDGTTQDSGTLTSTHPTQIARFLIGAGIFSAGPAMTIYEDLFAIDDADWIGAAVAASSLVMAPYVPA